MTNNRENLIRTIENLLAKANDKGATEAEAMQAGKMAQKLMAKYHIEELDLGKVKDDIVENYIVIRERYWMYSLAQIVANNFCCKAFTSSELDRDSLKFVKVAKFYGRDIDTQIAIKVFKSLLSAAQTGIRKQSQNFYRLYGTKKGVERVYANGFLKAVRSELEANCRALVLVVPKEVEDKFELQYSGKLKTIHARPVVVKDGTQQALHGVFNSGIEDGRNAAQRRKIHKD